MSTFGERLRTAIENSGRSLTSTAYAAGLDPPHLHKIMSGRTGLTVVTLGKLLRAMPTIDARWLVCGARRAE